MLIFQVTRIVMTLFGSLFVIAGLTALVCLWLVPDQFAGPFADISLLFRLLASLFAVFFSAFALFWIYMLWRLTGGFLESQHKQLQRLQEAAEPIRRRSAAVSCPNCGAKFLIENPATHAPANCSFCGGHIPISEPVNSAATH